MNPIRGLYAITPQESTSRQIMLEHTAAILSGGAGVLQFRHKHSPAPVDFAQKMAQLCRDFDATLIINDYVDLAVACDAAGVHLGHSDTSVTDARRVLGPQRIIGVSCYNSLELAIQAQRDGADYVAFGTVFPSTVKPDAPRVSLQLLAQACRSLDVPVVAIGGINADNARAVVRSGVDAIAVISSLYDSANPYDAAKRLSSMFDPHEPI